MVRKKKGWPEEGDVVIATVTKIQYHSVFCNLDEYDKSGMIHISEIAPGRIKSIHEYVKEGKTLVLRVLRLDKEKGHIDLSLRRVSESQKKLKAAEIKQQQLIEKIADKFAAIHKTDPDKILSKLETGLLKHYDSMMEGLQAVTEGTLKLESIGFSNKESKELEDYIKERIKPKTVSIKGSLEITSWKPDAIERIRKAFSEIPDELTVSYSGGGKYSVLVNAPDYKHAEEVLSSFIESIKKSLEGDSVEFTRTDKK